MSETAARRAGGVLLVGPRSSGPLVGGIENGIDMILRSPLVARHGVTFFNSYRERGEDRSLPERVRYQLGAFASFLGTIVRTRPRLVHVKVADGINFLQGIGYACLARMTGRATVVQIHGGEFDAWYARLPWSRKMLVRAGLHVPNVLLVLSDYWRDYVRPLAGRTPIRVIPNGVELDRVPPPARRNDAYLRVVTIGAIGVRKGHFDIVETAVRLGAAAPFRFRFVGSDEYGGETERLRARIAAAGIDHMIEFLGPRSGDAKWAALADADVFLLPAYNENMPNSVLEAMAAGLPVVCTDVGAVRQMVGLAGAAIVPTSAPEAIAETLERLRRAPDERAAMGAANRARAIEEYSFERVARDLDDLYERFAARAVQMRTPSPSVGAS